MSKIDDGGPAFPVADPMELRPGTVIEMERLAKGMSLRDYFATKALQGAIHHRGFATVHDGRALDAKDAYAYADAMIAARSAA